MALGDEIVEIANRAALNLALAQEGRRALGEESARELEDDAIEQLKKGVGFEFVSDLFEEARYQRDLDELGWAELGKISHAMEN